MISFLHWVGVALHPWPFMSDIAIFVLKGDVKLQLTVWWFHTFTHTHTHTSPWRYCLLPPQYGGVKDAALQIALRAQHCNYGDNLSLFCRAAVNLACSALGLDGNWELSHAKRLRYLAGHADSESTVTWQWQSTCVSLLFGVDLSTSTILSAPLSMIASNIGAIPATVSLETAAVKWNNKWVGNYYCNNS